MTTLNLSGAAEAQGNPSNFLSYGTVGHGDTSPLFCRTENNQALVEVTLTPSGEEIVARVMVADGQAFGGIKFGNRVVVGCPSGDGDDYVILGKLSDNTYPLPASVAGVALISPACPTWCFFRTGDGDLIAVESGDGADICVHSGGSLRLGVNAGEQILLAGRTHIGADFITPPIGPVGGPDGGVIPGVQGGPHVPLPYVLVPGIGVPSLPYLGPAQGILRAQDTLESDTSVDPSFWTWVLAVSAAPQVLAAMVGAGIPLPPIVLKSEARTASQHTAGD